MKNGHGDQKVTLDYANSCNLGKPGYDGVALKLNFAMSADEMKQARTKALCLDYRVRAPAGLLRPWSGFSRRQLIQIRKSMAALKTNAKNGRAAETN